jgi:hypothetical protein
MKTRGPSEAQIQKQIDDFLELDGWRIIRTDLPHLRGLGVQERGIPDRLYVRYEKQGPAPFGEFVYDRSWIQHLWIEMKKRGGKLSQAQKDWITRERARGALVIVAGEDFEASLDGFYTWYTQSGLRRVSVRLAK